MPENETPPIEKKVEDKKIEEIKDKVVDKLEDKGVPRGKAVDIVEHNAPPDGSDAGEWKAYAQRLETKLDQILERLGKDEELDVPKDEPKKAWWDIEIW